MDPNVQEGLRMDMEIEPEIEKSEPEVSEQSSDEEQKQADEPVKTEAEAEEKPAEPQMYTPEEIEQILKEDGQLDFNRLSPEGKLIYKSYDRGLKPKLQERAELLREMESMKAQMQALQTQIPRAQETFEQLAQRDPQQAIEVLNYAIARTEDAAEKTNLLQAKSMLQDRVLYNIQNGIQQTSQFQQVISATKEAVPEYSPDYRTELSEFAVKSMGYTIQELEALTDPRLGEIAIKNVKVIDTLYKQHKGAQTATAKIVKQAAPKVEKPGTGFEPAKPEKWSADEYLAARMKSSLS